MNDCETLVVTLTKKECKALVELLDQLTGGNPENVFAWDGSDTLSDPLTAVLARLFRETGREIPDSLHL